MNETGKQFKISVLPVTPEGEKLYAKFGFFNASLKGLISPLFSGGQTFQEKTEGHGSVKDWLNLLSSDHSDWILNFVYIDNNPIKKPTKSKRNKSNERNIDNDKIGTTQIPDSNPK